LNKIIALTGLMGSGKSFLSNEILLTENTACLYKFADPVYKCIDYQNRSEALTYLKKLIDIPLPTEVKIDRILKKTYAIETNDPKRREQLQFFGNEMRKQVNKTIWADILVSKIKREDERYIVIDDLRYMNEASHLIDLRGKNYQVLIIKVEADTETRQKRIQIIQPGHPSETEVCYIKPDVTIDNSLKWEKVAPEIVRLYAEEFYYGD